ncbi:hypothetical protein P2H57_16830 [Citrobacter freundii]|uniref:fimbrial protein n=1 Tax=Citrobacter sp. Cm038 TaxID=2985117 RepID=UPI001A1C24E6|nr:MULTISPECIES: hypothetical protein [Citrobacter]MDK2360848.1 hypothetical protein [Citrobacter freundii]MDM2943493.1 hypothetical protein [Citrobacter sp. Cm038]HAU4331431.1 type 1 fimbrial protein [Citrobacter freundii]
MKKVLLAASVMAALISGHVMASDTITINGEIIEKGCTIGENGNANIDLRTVTVAQVKETGIGSELANQADYFMIKDCPAGYEVELNFIADIPPGYDNGIVNTEAPSNTVVAHYLRDARPTHISDHVYLTNPSRNQIYLDNDERTKAQSSTGFSFPIESGYLKTAEVDGENTPAGLTKSVVTLNVYYRQ